MRLKASENHPNQMTEHAHTLINELIDDAEEFFHWARNRAKDALEKTYHLNGTI